MAHISVLPSCSDKLNLPVEVDGTERLSQGDSGVIAESTPDVMELDTKGS